MTASTFPPQDSPSGTPGEPAPILPAELRRRTRVGARRALAGLTPGIWMLFAAALVLQSLSVHIPGVLVAMGGDHVADWMTNVARTTLFFSLVFVPVLLGVTAVANLGPQRGIARLASLVIAVVIAVCVGLLLKRELFLLLDYTKMTWAEWRTGVLHLWLEYAVISGTVMAVAELIRWQRASVAAMHRVQIDSMALDREMAEARMQVMQAQIEPHFLFNTLANVRRLFRTDPTSGMVMLDNLMRYFAVALPRMREADSNLLHEQELIEAYLNVHQIRMGPRLAFAVDFPTALHSLRVPPMMLLTLVENAIKHGLNPLPEGGSIRVTAAIEAAALVLRVSDSGRGFHGGEGAGGGTGLANIRARLHAEYGPYAGLTLAANEPRGIMAQINLPLTSVEAAA